MAITTKWYGRGVQHIMQQDVNLVTATIKATLHTSSYTADRDNHEFRSSLSSEVANGSGYTTGGITITNRRWSYDTASHRVYFKFDDLTWAFTASKTWRSLVLQNVRGGASTADELIAICTWDSDQTLSTSYTFQLPTLGLLYNDVS